MAWEHPSNFDVSEKYYKSKTNGDNKTQNNFTQQFDEAMEQMEKLSKKVKRMNKKKRTIEESVGNRDA